MCTPTLNFSARQGGWPMSHPSHFKRELVHFAQDAGWTLGSVWTGMQNLTNARVQTLDHSA